MIQLDGAARADALRQLVAGYSIEVTARSKKAVELCRQHLRPGCEVFIAHIPGDPYHRLIDRACELHQAGFTPVPHVVARQVASFTQARTYLARLVDEAGVSRALFVAGDIAAAAGPYESTTALLRTGLAREAGLRRIGLACHPEGHRMVADDVMARALDDKLDLVKQQGLQAFLVSQFCFEAEPIIAFLHRLHARGIATPLRVGLAGPADRRLLWKYALHCGIGNSVRALGDHIAAITNLLDQERPDALLTDLAAGLQADPDLGIEGIHMFPFGHVKGAVDWAEAILAGR